MTDTYDASVHPDSDALARLLALASAAIGTNSDVYHRPDRLPSIQIPHRAIESLS